MYIYSYIPNVEDELTPHRFLAEMEARASGHYQGYKATIARVASTGRANDDKWHRLNTTDIPDGVMPGHPDRKHALDDMGEFKHIGDKSRIYHLLEGNLIVMLGALQIKKEDKLKAWMINPSLKLRTEFFTRRANLLRRRAGSR